MVDESNDVDNRELVEIAKVNIGERISNFASLLGKLTGLDDKAKQLWTEIYENAICDRQNSYVMFMRLAQISGAKSTEHAIHGKSLASYIERMQKANEQLLRLAELVAKVDRETEPMNVDDVFSQIRKK
jgi:hypothetical protein